MIDVLTGDLHAVIRPTSSEPLAGDREYRHLRARSREESHLEGSH
jgi:hypothetical protein